MTNEEFVDLRDKFNDECEEAMKLKGEAYTQGTSDRLANFKKNAEKLGLTPLQVWSVYFGKHLDAIYFYLRSGKAGPEGVRENLKDARNYIDLGLALITEYTKEIE